jgi:hypothetical protein
MLPPQVFNKLDFTLATKAHQHCVVIIVTIIIIDNIPRIILNCFFGNHVTELAKA